MTAVGIAMPGSRRSVRPPSLPTRKEATAESSGPDAQNKAYSPPITSRVSMPFPATATISLAGLLLLVTTTYWGAVVCMDACGLLPWGPGVEDGLDDWS